MFLLLGLELKSVYQDRNEHDREQATTREKEERNFKEIAGGIADQIATSDRNFSVTMARSDRIMTGVNTAVTAQTGGDSYVVVTAVAYKADDSELTLAVRACDKCAYNIPSARIFVRQMAPKEEPHSTQVFDGVVEKIAWLPTTKKIAPPRDGTITELKIQVFPLNKPTTEVLEVRFNTVKATWEATYIVARSEKEPNHLDPKSGMLSGLVAKELERQPWASAVLVHLDPTSVHVIPKQQP
jgi:hypothetical protein